MRVLFSAHGSFGHVLPMVDLAGALADAGHQVRFATGEPLCATVSSRGLRAVAAGISDDGLVGEALRRWPEARHRPPASWAPRMFTEIAAPRMLADLVPIIDSFGPDLVIREEGEHAAPVAAAATGIPWVTHGWGSPLPARPVLEELAERVAPLWRSAGLRRRSADELYGGCLLDPCPRSLYGRDAPPVPVTAVRPMPPPAPEHHSPPASRGSPLVYVGFGTVPLYRDPPQLIEAVVRALTSRGFHAVVTISDPTLAARLTDIEPERVTVEPWVSLHELLGSCRLVVSHGGAGTTLAALAAGLPLLLLPRGAPSQARMSHACHARGVARVIDTEPVSTSDLDDALRSVTADPRYRSAAREVAGEIAATSGPDQIAQLLQTRCETGLLQRAAIRR